MGHIDANMINKVYFHLDLQGNTGRKMREARLFQDAHGAGSAESKSGEYDGGTRPEAAGEDRSNSHGVLQQREG